MPLLRNGAIVTVQQHIIEQQRKHPTATGQFSWLLSAITLSTKIISSYVRRAGLVDIWGADGSNKNNVQGELVQKLDRIANETLQHSLGYRENVGVIASEEDDLPKVLHEVGAGGHYIVMFDPLDGSSNIDSNVPVGTIFTIMGNPPQALDTEQAVLQPGIRQLAAGYVVYGSSTVLVYTTGEGVHMFTLDPQFGAYLLVKEHLRIPEFTPQYSVNEAYAPQFPKPYQQYLDHVKHDPQGWSMRYIGSLVADFHRILLQGGVFLYPPTEKNTQGKLRLMYEANPLAFIAEQAGGAATDGQRRILDIPPRQLHQRVPLILGGRKNVQQVHEFLGGKTPAAKAACTPEPVPAPGAEPLANSRSHS
jgi:fructose-1,6-bisphosphatase I